MAAETLFAPRGAPEDIERGSSFQPKFGGLLGSFGSR